jgi:NAD(P)-dependent dehydrogenase (short-subunit alcohol dehydrogenase family)
MAFDEPPMTLENKVAVVTGGGGGIAGVVVKKFVAEGAFVLAADIVEPVFPKDKERIRTCRADISSIEDVERLHEICRREFGAADILVNAAGIQAPIGPFHTVDFRDWAYNLNVNLLGPVLCAKTFLPDLMKKGSGKIINFAGGGATSPRPNFSAYGTAKTAVVRFTESLAEELRPFNIQVNAVSPGVIRTRMIEEILDKGADAVGAEYGQIQKRLTSGFDSPELVAELVIYLASEEANWISGKTISAVWDSWRDWRDQGVREESRDMYVLRRIDGRNFIQAKKQ